MYRPDPLDTAELERNFPSALDGNPHPRAWHDEPATAAREWCGGCGRLLGLLECDMGAALCADCEPSPEPDDFDPLDAGERLVLGALVAGGRS